MPFRKKSTTSNNWEQNKSKNLLILKYILGANKYVGLINNNLNEKIYLIIGIENLLETEKFTMEE